LKEYFFVEKSLLKNITLTMHIYFPLLFFSFLLLLLEPCPLFQELTGGTLNFLRKYFVKSLTKRIFEVIRGMFLVVYSK